MRTVWAEVNLDAIAYNIQNIKKLTGSKQIIAVVKADGYGHGAIDIVPVLLENGVTKLAVAVLTEAIELRNSNIKAPIMILGHTGLNYAEDIIKYDIEQTVYDLQYAKELSKIAKSQNKKAKIHIALDTGMGRIGFIPNEESLREVKEISDLEGISIEGIFTHFATADENDKSYTFEQFSKFKQFNKRLEELGVNIALKHCSNSGAIIDLPDTYLDAVRAGIIIYGYYPSGQVNKERLPLKPALMLKTKVVHIKEIEKDNYISYGRTFKTEKKSTIATLPIGYADGYSRLLSGKVKVIINGKFANVIGRICMDQCMVDVTDIENVKIGDEVILLGEEGSLTFNANDIADILGTINYEVICMLRQRIPRVYIRNNKVVNVRNYI